ncbi:uncharacterized protein Z520_10929 [Fonsecaea multimorphosa CBS 102226]|uniref:Beta-galactosidase n=1 Tax=Fonsecaea multimorphosa CBS 102226 TaxID=1442371 RepID=A0A0D2I7W9_9EURO|nr:uncharacterized protein Z520_10929 [Fonsecaea multimorphosa CBS 102226]KIX93286.1 hypothetical protein Z520_10929 [Fonsecaea multimorphosa CBS 102226]OAL18525.1 hypothetical protein AYO22_10502 [Fonsecaea multimorphosa]
MFIRGERLMLLSGEFHPFRLPSPGLWLDVFQKVKAIGYNGVSFYTDWGLLEGQPGEVVAQGVFALQEFFSAASQAGIYLTARPGPYINAETAAGGFPGWVLRINDTLRSDTPGYLDATQNYVSTIGAIMAKAQITNGGPVILIQPENEYTTWPGVNISDFPELPQKEYMAYVEGQFRDAGIIVPFVFNDNEVQGDFAPGTGLGETDVYGIDAYPLRYDCAHPTVWPNIRFPRDWQIFHEQQSPSTPFAVLEFQGGTGTSWGTVSQDMCNALVNEEAVRILYKNNYSFGVKIQNIYMFYGGTNWGNLGYMGGDSSYDYGAAMTESRHVWREKYSEMKLQANFFKVSPAYLTAMPGNETNGTYTVTDDITVTPVFATESNTGFYVVRHANWTSLDITPYNMTVSTSIGDVMVPQQGGHLTLFGRDAKLFLTDYDVGGINMIYSSAEVFTWNTDSSGKTVLILYGGANELHEMAFPPSLPAPSVAKGSSTSLHSTPSGWIIQWTVVPDRQILTFGSSLEIHLLWRNDAYTLWTLELEASAPISNFSSPSKDMVVVKGGYLMRTAAMADANLYLTGDLNCTTTVELISSPSEVECIFFNGEQLTTSTNAQGKLESMINFVEPSLSLPSLADQTWWSISSLPELSDLYSDAAWTECTHTYTTNPLLNLSTPTSLYASDYGFHTSSLLYRGHFTAEGTETSFFANISGGWAFGHSAWLNGTHLGSWAGDPGNKTYAQTFTFPEPLVAGSDYVLTLLIDHMGQDEEAPGTDAVKFPMGLLDFSISNRSKSDVEWKIQGNLGGENYIDKVRGPRNEGALFVERMGYHLPFPPIDTAAWSEKNPMDPTVTTIGPGAVEFFATNFTLAIPDGYDVPLSFVFANTSASSPATSYRAQLWINGWQFGKYISHLGPQTSYPVPEGILNYQGVNWVGVSVWSLAGPGGAPATLDGLDIVANMPVMSGMARPAVVDSPAWASREGAY